MQKILFLSAWYPHRYDAMSGLFVRRHAQAVARVVQTCVLFLYADKNIKKFEIIEQKCENVYEVYIYFPFCKNRLLKRISKTINYLRAFNRGLVYIKKNFGSPNFTIANILTRSGFLALLLKKTHKIPYSVIEHWSKYLPENFNYNGFIYKKITENVVKNAECVFAVSKRLKDAMQNVGLTHPNFYIIDNVVDDFFFEQVEKHQRNKKRIILVSCFSEKSKNVCGMLNAVRNVALQRIDFEFIIIGSGEDFNMIKQHYQSLNFPKNIVNFLGELPVEQVVMWMQQSDFAIHFSNFETYGIVIAESLASGLPLISTPAGIAPDEINRHSGFLVNFRDETALSDKINFMLDNFQNYNRLQISYKAKERFDTQKIGERLITMLNNHKK